MSRIIVIIFVSCSNTNLGHVIINTVIIITVRKINNSSNHVLFFLVLNRFVFGLHPHKMLSNNSYNVFLTEFCDGNHLQRKIPLKLTETRIQTETIIDTYPHRWAE